MKKYWWFILLIVAPIAVMIGCLALNNQKLSSGQANDIQMYAMQHDSILSQICRKIDTLNYKEQIIQVQNESALLLMRQQLAQDSISQTEIKRIKQELIKYTLNQKR